LVEIRRGSWALAQGLNEATTMLIAKINTKKPIFILV